jgi:hypothetical protein
MAKAQADHAIRVLQNAKLVVSGDVIQFIFPDGSITSLLVDKGERKVGTLQHYEKALASIEWLHKHGIMTDAEFKRVDDRIMRLATGKQFEKRQPKQSEV